MHLDFCGPLSVVSHRRIWRKKRMYINNYLLRRSLRWNMLTLTILSYFELHKRMLHKRMYINYLLRRSLRWNMLTLTILGYFELHNDGGGGGSLRAWHSLKKYIGVIFLKNCIFHYANYAYSVSLLIYKLSFLYSNFGARSCLEVFLTLKHVKINQVCLYMKPKEGRITDLQAQKK